MTSKHYELQVEVEEDIREESTKAAGGELTAQATLNPRYTFSTFVVGNNNNLAHAASLAVAERLARAYNPLFLYGGSGLGKTHLLHAIGNCILENHADKRVMYTTSEKFTNELINSIRTETTQKFRDKYRHVDLLLVDDIQFLATREGIQEEFFHTFNALYEDEKQIVLTSDRLPSDIPRLEDRLRTRFQMGLLADVQPPDYETRMAILRNKIQGEYLTVDQDIVEYVADSITSNVRDLEGAVKRMLAYAGIQRTNKISMDLAQRALKDILTLAPKKKATPAAVIDCVEKFYNIPKGSLMSSRRSKDIAHPRQVAMYLIRDLLDFSLPQIGAEFNRDHTTVMHNVGKIKAELESNPALEAELKEIQQNINRSS